MSFCPCSRFLRNTRAVRTLATLWRSALLAAALGSRQFWRHLTHLGIYTKMTALNLWPCLKWKWASTTALEKVSSAVWSESSLQRKVSHMIIPIKKKSPFALLCRHTTCNDVRSIIFRALWGAIEHMGTSCVSLGDRSALETNSLGVQQGKDPRIWGRKR